ncbi:MAG: hypothetical protein KGY69_19515, partial [Bacteroidales bacterium]|nr:hypothetical protein [Bacteroidales bacterium]
VDLDGLPFDESNFPEELRDRIYYDANNKKLHFYGLMSGEEKTKLKDLSTEQTYQDAIENLFEEPRFYISQRMKAFVLPSFSAELDIFPPEVVIPDRMKDKIYYDQDEKALFLIGWMTETERDTLKNEAADNKDFCDAIDQLYEAPFNYIPEEENQFLKEEDVEKLIDAPEIPSRFGVILKKLLPYIRCVQSTNLVIQKIADALRLETKTAEQLLTRWVLLPANYTSGEKAIDILLSTDFAESNPNVNLTFTAFPKQFNTCILLHKISLIIEKLEVKVDDLPLLFQRSPGVWDNKGWADLNFLPLTSLEDPTALYRAAEKLFALFSFRNLLLPGEPTLFEILNKAFNPEYNTLEDFLSSLNEKTGWKLEDLQELGDWFGYDLADFTNMKALIRFIPCFKIIKRVGVSAKKICEWISIPEDPNEAMEKAYQTARSIKQSAKAKYDNERWLEVAKPLRDDLREKQRSALVSYLIAHYVYGDRTFRNSNDLYAHFLIDPEMDPCMMTSRLKLATSSVQLFIQRCLMNLEEWKIPNALTAQEWNIQWGWMKNYRVWEANRKVFLYPENWIEPELRDDKSPFFKDMENELLQNEITADHVEKVFLKYIEKLDAVSQLEICGMYHEQESEGQNGIGRRPVDVLHVFGRTRGTPHIYYYRRRIASDGETVYWTPWEKVDMDIEGNHLIPVVWNRRLYLFWPVFIEKAKENIPEENATNEEKKSEKYWEIQMAWSEYRNGKWSAKKVSNKLIDISKVVPGLHIQDAPLEWDKERFYFITEIRKNDLIIECRIDDQCCLNCAHKAASFRFTGCDDSNAVIYHTYFDKNKRYEFSYLRRPANAIIYFMTFLENSDNDSLQLYSGKFENFETTETGNVVLWRTPGNYTIIPPHHDPYFLSQDSFFYQDETRTFFVTPQGTGISYQPDIYNPYKPALEWENPNSIQPEQLETVLPDYYEIIPEYEHWEDMYPPVLDIDPPIIEDTFPVGTYYDETVGQSYDYGFYSTSAGAAAERFAARETSFHPIENSS